MSSIRSFVAVSLPEAVLVSLEQLQTRLQRGPGGNAGRWVRASGIHLTLKFLGDVSSKGLDAVYADVQQSCERHQPFHATIEGLGCFPNTRRPRNVWVGVHDKGAELRDLQHDIERALERAGFAREGRPFTPHLTLARVKRQAHPADIRTLGSFVAQLAGCQIGELVIDQVHVIKSDLEPQGAVYTQLYSAPLGRVVAADTYGGGRDLAIDRAPTGC